MASASLQDMKKTQGAAITSAQNHPILSKTSYLEKRKDLLGAGLPSHMTVEREIRTATVMLMQSNDLQLATPESFYTAVSVAVNSGIGLGNGKGYLVAYKGKVSFVPGWKGLTDLVSRSGRGTVWTGVVHAGDHFEYALGDSPFLTHRPGDNEDHDSITHYYAVGRVKGSDWPLIEVWSVKKVLKHLKQYNKVGSGHYAHKDENNMEMYGRKVVLLQILKYMPQSQDIENAITANTAAELNKGMTIEGNFMYINEEDITPPQEQPQQQPAQTAQPRNAAVDVQDTSARTEAADADEKFKKLAHRIANATDIDMLDADADLIREFPAEDQEILRKAYAERKEQLSEGAKPAARPRRQMSVD